jgi:hypothetical protein
MVIAVYSIDCLTKGSCNALSWFSAGILFIWCLMILNVAVTLAIKDVYTIKAYEKGTPVPSVTQFVPPM